MNIIQQIVRRNKAGHHAGIYSCCSANPDVIRAVLLRSRRTQTPVLIEATSNQVNQMGGYTGMQAADFARFVKDLAVEMGVSFDNVILGGDHLGPLPWTNLPEEEAMANAEDLVVSFVKAGFQKIHLDTSMRVASDDPAQPFLTKTCAERGARLCAACEQAFVEYQQDHPDAEPPVYIIGSEVPVPGGDFNAGEMGVTTSRDAVNTISIYKRCFQQAGIAEAFERVVGIVFEMGVEFHEFNLDEYDRRRTVDLVKSMRKIPLAIEGHSSDYQTTANLTRMCEYGVAILKVGPAFTFSLREAMFALENIEKEVYHNQPERLSHYREVLDAVMVEDPKHWQSYYPGTENEQRIARSYSFYDRCRYYLTNPRVVAARNTLLENLSGNTIPLCLLSQYLPTQYVRVRRGEIRNEALDIVLDRIGDRVDCYLEATNNCGQGTRARYARFDA